MKLKVLLTTMLMAVTVSMNAKTVDIIPTPAQIVTKGGVFKYGKTTTIAANTAEGKMVAEQFAARMQDVYKVTVTPVEANAAINITVNPTLSMGNEAYTMTVSPKMVTIEAKTAQGAFYATQSLVQLGVPAQCCVINDQPRFAYRGVHLDPCRHFITVENVKKQLDLMSMLKMNRMHFHLTEDQGWRVEIKKYPKLTEIGAVRNEPEGGQTTGYYTQEEIKDIVKYAAERHITVIPEVDLPGHMMAAISAYPELSCKGEAVTPRIIWGVEDIVLCPGKELVFGFLEDVVKELCQLFPGEYFHIGGDECPKTSWKHCPFCQQRIKEEGLEAKDGHSAEERLQSYVINRMEKVLAKYGKKIIGWDEILEGGLSPNATVMSWRGEEGGIAAAQQNHDVIMTPGSGGMYLDAYQGDNKIEPLAIGGYSPLEKVYAYDPVPQKLLEAGVGSHVLGVQCNNWSEYFYTPAQMEYMMYPRTLAVAEIGWTPLNKKNFKDFCRRADVASSRYLDHYGFTYHIPLPEQVTPSCNTVAFTNKVTIPFKTSRPMKIVYTTDGTQPTAKSKVYTKPLTFTKTTTLHMACVTSTGKVGPVRHIDVVKEALSPATEVAEAKPGIIMTYCDGVYKRAKDLEDANIKWQTKEIKDLRDLCITRQENFRNTRGLEGHATIGEGYVMIPEDGVYYFTTQNEQFWIDGRLLINNVDEPKKFSRKDSSIALKKGLHPIKTIFIANITGGFPAMWEHTDVNIRAEKDKDFKRITPDMLFH